MDRRPHRAAAGLRGSAWVAAVAGNLLPRGVARARTHRHLRGRRTALVSALARWRASSRSTTRPRAARRVELLPGGAPRTLPDSLKPTLRMRIVRAHTVELDVLRDGSTAADGSVTTFRDVGFAAGAGWRDWYFKLEPATTPWGVLGAEGRVAQRPPFEVHATVDFKHDAAQPAELKIVAKGPLERIDLDGSLSAQDASLTLHAVATPYADLPLDALDVRLHAFDPRHFAPTAPAGCTGRKPRAQARGRRAARQLSRSPIRSPARSTRRASRSPRSMLRSRGDPTGSTSRASSPISAPQGASKARRAWRATRSRWTFTASASICTGCIRR